MLKKFKDLESFKLYMYFKLDNPLPKFQNVFRLTVMTWLWLKYIETV